uniref:EB domain-containing protein n=1 Tax=Anopheles culicifacies TaxID=139723 RepID=A0A182LYK6_9DIPT
MKLEKNRFPNFEPPLDVTDGRKLKITSFTTFTLRFFCMLFHASSRCTTSGRHHGHGQSNLPPMHAGNRQHTDGAELNEYCRASQDCRPYAHVCDTRKQTCDCAEGYRPDEAGRMCLGAVGRRCLYDSHCITNAYCKGQMICTCKREYGFLADDNWSCQESNKAYYHIEATGAPVLLFCSVVGELKAKLAGYVRPNEAKHCHRCAAVLHKFEIALARSLGRMSNEC